MEAPPICGWVVLVVLVGIGGVGVLVVCCLGHIPLWFGVCGCWCVGVHVCVCCLGADAPWWFVVLGCW